MPRPPQKQSKKSQHPKLASILLLRVKSDKHIANVLTQRKKEMLEETRKTC